MNLTTIEWTNFSANALKMRMPDGTLTNVCVHISPGCVSCYAESIVRRFWRKAWGEFPGYTAALLKIGTPVLDHRVLEKVLKRDAAIAEGKADPAQRMVFWHDMTDEYLDFWPTELLDQIWAVRALTPNLIHQVLTKRPERMAEYFTDLDEAMQNWYRAAQGFMQIDDFPEHLQDWDWSMDTAAPLPNVWLGCSVEDQQRADERIPHLMRCPAAVRFISAEPLLGPLELRPYLFGRDIPGSSVRTKQLRLSWVIAGGESGPGARPCNVEWIRSIIQQCKAAGVPVFVKQLGANFIHPLWVGSEGSSRDRIELKDPKGGDIREFPIDLQIREFPFVKGGVQ